MEDLDISKPGFFHLCIELNDKKNEDDTAQLKYWIKRQKYLRSILKKHSIPSPQKLAVKNTIGIFLYQITDNKDHIRKFFQQLLEQSGHNHINTIANLLYILKHLQNEAGDNDDENREKYKTQISTLEKKLHEAQKDQLSQAISLCERGYFVSYQFDGHIQNSLQSQLVSQMLATGIEQGSKEGMSQLELYVWKYYLLDNKIKIFSFVQAEQETSEDDTLNCFKDIVDSFDDISTISSEECVFYRSHAILDVILLMTNHEELITKLPNFQSECERSFLVDLWEDRFSAMEVAFEMFEYDYQIPAKIAKVYCRVCNYDEALQYTDKSLSIEKEICTSAYLTRMIAHAKMSKHFLYETKQNDLAEETLRKAYNEGKNIERIYMPIAAAVEMAAICYHLALDQSKPRWSLAKGRIGYMKEAITYNQKAISKSHGKKNPRLQRQLSDCFWFMDKFRESLDPLRIAVETSQANMMARNFKCLLHRYCILFKDKGTPVETKSNVVTHAVAVFENVWDKIAPSGEIIEEIRRDLISFTQHMTKQEQYLKAILNEFSLTKSIPAKQMFNAYCRIILDCKDTPHWLREYIYTLL